ncbi:ABC transporter permease [Paenibacillus sp. J31TS4]|uniref:ABC transporter permease n=1 Tax=Paenibacillus sp. J31TS4 TaxID=2807195 RepID=UPI001B203FA1|nr:hypothetical protein [Paenibacillus sp. J31TS4]GIP38062.1 ABC transporter permease [Paenibacillus sp. J31TS4]
MLFAVLARKAYARNLQYRGSHLLNTIASSLFGFVYVSIWIGVGDNRTLGEYGVDGMVSYVAFNQACLWLTVFLTNGLGLETAVRSGQVSLDLMRPVHLFYVLMSREWGQLLYQLLYKVVPIYLLYVLALGIRMPERPVTWLWTILALALASYLSICIQYLIGVCALWTTESRWLVWVNIALSQLLSGFLIPLEWLPGWLQTVSRATFYPFLQYMPTRIYLEMEGPNVLAGTIGWCLVMTVLCLGITRLVRRKVEVQGG